MKRLNLKPTIDPVFTAEEWQLFTCSMDCTGPAGELNYNLKWAINSGLTRRDAEKHMGEIMRKLSDFGACDSEPIWFLEPIMDKIYGGSDDWK
jgi:hypothetical protein